MKRRDTTTIESLRSTKHFGGCTDQELEQIDAIGSVLRVDAGTTLTVEGAGARQAMIILHGTAEVTRGGDHIATIGPGSIVGEVALLGDGIRTATVTASTRMDLLVVNAAEFRRLVEISDGIARAVERANRRNRAAVGLDAG